MSYQDEYEDLLAPENFAMVETGVYRSAFPRSKNIPFLRSLRLRAVVALIPEDYPVHMTDFYEQCGVKLISHGLDGNKWPFKEIDEIGTCLSYECMTHSYTKYRWWDIQTSNVSAKLLLSLCRLSNVNLFQLLFELSLAVSLLIPCPIFHDQFYSYYHFFIMQI